MSLTQRLAPTHSHQRLPSLSLTLIDGSVEDSALILIDGPRCLVKDTHHNFCIRYLLQVAYIASGTCQRKEIKGYTQIVCMRLG